jgi:hypothetical protein
MIVDVWGKEGGVGIAGPGHGLMVGLYEESCLKGTLRSNNSIRAVYPTNNTHTIVGVCVLRGRSDRYKRGSIAI